MKITIENLKSWIKWKANSILYKKKVNKGKSKPTKQKSVEYTRLSEIINPVCQIGAWVLLIFHSHYK